MKTGDWTATWNPIKLFKLTCLNGWIITKQNMFITIDNNMLATDDQQFPW